MRTTRHSVVLALVLCFGSIAMGDNPHALDAADGSPADAVYVTNDGYVGIGVYNATSLLDVFGGAIRARRNSDQFIEIKSIDGSGSYVTGYSRKGNKKPLYISSLHHGDDSAAGETRIHFRVGEDSSPITAMTVLENGNVGIGTRSPEAQLEVHGDTHLDRYVSVRDFDDDVAWIRLIARDNNWMFYKGGVVVGGYSNDAIGEIGNGNMIVRGNVGIGTTSPQAKLDVAGRIRISNAAGEAVMELGEGLDYAEGFDVSDSTEMGPGSVLIIDADNPGKLALSGEPYDSKVAGIVAGAKGKTPGVRLGADQFDFDVALAGRVHCNVDATEVGVEPGDLLTTSIMPGYAMKAVDHARAQGAILGKAMEGLDKGKKDQILVLVTLQ